ncbi:MAG: Holliday junction resolvase RuvX [Omnitrophica WOR_2 bacterium]
MRILAIDPGEKHIGIAISDPTGTIANPVMVLKHSSRLLDAAAIAQFASEHEVSTIVVGQSLDEEGLPTPEGRRSGRLADAIQSQTTLPVVLWDESGSTQEARLTRIAMGVSRRKRKGHQDDLAAAIILQSYLDTRKSNGTGLPG